jgi:NitT/TauT family transport system substrate-binding protein
MCRPCFAGVLKRLNPPLVVSLGLFLALLGCDGRAAEPSAFAGPARSVSSAAVASKSPLRVAYSDWPGWTAFEVGIQEGWFKKAGIDVEFSWADYLPSLDAFQAGRVDAVMVTNADALVTGAGGAKSKMILLTDYSNGNDKVVARAGIGAFKDLKGKRVGLEFTLIEHLLFLKACEKNGMKTTDVELVNFATSETPQALTTGDVAAIAAWYPISGQALRFAAGAKPVFTSADVPGLIYDAVAVSPESLARRHDDWVKFARVWYKISDFIRNPRTRDRAIAIMAAKVGVKPQEYAAAMPGTYFLSLEEAKKRYARGDGLDSLYGSTSVADDFNVSNKVYKKPQPVEEYIEPAIVTSL